MTSVDKELTTTTPSEREIVWSRAFDAPRQLVFDAWTRSDLIPRWLTPNGWTMPVCEVDLRPGGHYRYVLRRTDGSAEMTMRGTYHEVAAPGRFVCSQSFEGFDEVGWRPEDETEITTEFHEQGGQTIWTARLVYPSQAARDAVMAMGMEFERFDALLAELQTV